MRDQRKNEYNRKEIYDVDELLEKITHGGNTNGNRTNWRESADQAAQS